MDNEAAKLQYALANGEGSQDAQAQMCERLEELMQTLPPEDSGVWDEGGNLIG